jgi:putative transposase
MRPARYAIDLTDRAWAVVRPLRPPAQPGGRPRRRAVRRILDAICSVLRRGCAWRLLPRDVPQWSTGGDYCRKGRRACV